MAAVTEADVAGLLNANISSPAAAIPVITAMAKSYTRGRGFADDGTPNDEIAAVITTAAARLASNTRQTNGSTTTPDITVDKRTYFDGWTLAEQFVLNRYRVRAR
ncbi:hypothetical protein C3477_23875 [Mycobacterium kansasii]|uniref:hypothetical protein n=1 Tax=Mycobacterium kansasii TaxID=1768 RepID=UPI000CDE34EC|nr:hypothetical protein [Mycobacterium kansasii]POX82194.1 hypothetical protein C3B43_25840 [Mycobacterium kansasii]POX98436.1 hypothetical protein C3477_23875 [Mycobacterium kansasii]POY20188.1 hypothetical protein C3476_15930 [Mycobacterium kansasii]